MFKLFSKRKTKQIKSLFQNKQTAVVEMGGDYCQDVC